MKKITPNATRQLFAFLREKERALDLSRAHVIELENQVQTLREIKDCANGIGNLNGDTLERLATMIKPSAFETSLSRTK